MIRPSLRFVLIFALASCADEERTALSEARFEVLGFYLTQEISLTSYFRDDTGESAFHKSVRANLTRLLSEPREPTAHAAG